MNDPAGWGASASDPQAPSGTALIGKAVALLDAIGETGACSISDLLRRTAWPRATLYRILGALEAHGYVRADPASGLYGPGHRILDLAQSLWSEPDLAAIASVELRRLRDMTAETAYIAVPRDGAMLALGKFESPHPVRSSARLGVRKPMHCTSQGKAVLAFLPLAKRDQLIERLDLARFTPHTITDREALKAQLGIVRSRGYAIEDQEILLGNRCVGAPVLDQAGDPVAAISVAGPVYRMTSERAEQLGPELASIAREISRQARLSTRRAPTQPSGFTPLEGQERPAFYGADPVWDANRKALVWCDQLGPSLFRHDGARVETYQPGRAEPIRALWLNPDGSATILIGDQTERVDGATPVARRAANGLETITATTTDAQGRVIAALSTTEGSVIVELDTMRTLFRTQGVLNALAWSRFDQCLYAAEANRGVIYKFSERSAPRIVTRLPRVSGEPRGLAIDPSGALWATLYDGWSVIRLNEEGEVAQVLPLPAPRPTGLAFGGATGWTLHVTTARHGLSLDILDHAPLSGLLLRQEIGPAPSAT